MPTTPLTMTPAQAQVGESAQQVRNQAIGNIFGLFMSKYNDKRQLAQQQKLQALQIAGDKELQDYSFNKQLQMWKDTNYSAQMEELKKAGLNPGLLYGMSGGGGVTTGSSGGPSVTGGQAPAGGREILDFSNQALQMGIMRAQKANIEADTKKKEAEIPKIETETKSLTQGIENQKAIETLTKVQTEISKLDVQYLQGSLNDRLNQVKLTAEKTIEEIKLLKTENSLNTEQFNDKIKLLKAEIAQKLVENALTSQKITESKAEIEKWSIELEQAWANIEIHKQELELRTWVEKLKSKYPGVFNVIGRVLNDVVEGIGRKLGQKDYTREPN